MTLPQQRSDDWRITAPIGTTRLNDWLVVAQQRSTIGPLSRVEQEDRDLAEEPGAVSLLQPGPRDSPGCTEEQWVVAHNRMGCHAFWITLKK